MNWGRKWGNFGVEVMKKMADDYNDNYKSNDNSNDNKPRESFFSAKNLLGSSFDMWWKMRKY